MLLLMTTRNVALGEISETVPPAPEISAPSVITVPAVAKPKPPALKVMAPLPVVVILSAVLAKVMTPSATRLSELLLDHEIGAATLISPVDTVPELFDVVMVTLLLASAVSISVLRI